MTDPVFTFASPADLGAIQELLQACDLPWEDISGYLTQFIVAKEDGRLMGSIGLEVYEKVGLLRSLAVADDCRGQGIARKLYDRLLTHGLSLGIEELYLLTTTAAAYFARLGFRKVARDSLPEAIRATKEFQGLCPVSAICMVLEVKG